jgi:hypothetical protein
MAAAAGSAVANKGLPSISQDVCSVDFDDRIGADYLEIEDESARA